MRAAFCATLALLPFAAWSQAYPAKPIRLVVPFGPGGTTDILGRVIADRLGARLGQQVIVDNRPGAGGNIAAEAVARSAPDGYTLFLGSMGTQAMNGAIYPKLAFDPIHDFAPITRLVNSANLLVVHPSIPVTNVKQLIQLAKSKPGQLNYSTSGIGSFNHMSAELFQMMAGVKMVHVAYKSGGQALTAVLVGESQLLFQTIPPAVPFVESGKLRALAVCSAERHPLFPKLPTASESGLPGFEVSTWYGILAPAAAPRELVTRLNDALVQVVKVPATQKRLTELGLDPAPNTPGEFAALIKADALKWGKVIKAAQLKAE
ncbi:MAG TPA: tripartite tricarboxylate transporter substrate binding protein [Burkholderiales bacterium]|nr:tripartite tricarboxylate transporter substrate binding protein [Burkholderiales bacterium]